MAPETAGAAAGVLEAPPPRFSPSEIAVIAAELFEVRGNAVDLGSERDQTFLIDGESGGGIIKISNLGEDTAVLDLEAEAILHVLRVDPDLPVARPLPAAGGGAPDTVSAYRAAVEGPDGTHFVRMFERLHGRSGPAATVEGRPLAEYAATHARLTRALQGFFHPAAGRELLWDAKHTPQLRQFLHLLPGERGRTLVADVIERFETRVRPRWARLPAQVVHGDFTLDNVLVDERGRITGIADFGDIVHTARVADFAVGLASLLRARAGDELFRTARRAIDGYGSSLPLEPDELAVLADLVSARLAALVTISAWRSRRYPENLAYIQAWDADSWALLELFAEMGADAVAHELGAPRRPASTHELAQRRGRALGTALTDLSYRTPVHVVSGRGVWLFEAGGRRLLDAYNNVPVVGHCHPRVTEAVVRQTRALNTHARYLYEPLVELAERLAASMPPGSALDTAMIVNSGSEANDLAWRIATANTERTGAI
ncbi:MAG: aminotransferase class III-fold pyridoxal phosphate-dependent enzyme, partial [Thermoleophilia bacterium]|nr:aminotransferase class III-fold pyridoxal phosphate-dependent enzyme [Thermoleophilia bacterium]